MCVFQSLFDLLLICTVDIYPVLVMSRRRFSLNFSSTRFPVHHITLRGSCCDHQPSSDVGLCDSHAVQRLRLGSDLVLFYSVRVRRCRRVGAKWLTDDCVCCKFCHFSSNFSGVFLLLIIIVNVNGFSRSSMNVFCDAVTQDLCSRLIGCLAASPLIGQVVAAMLDQRVPERGASEPFMTSCFLFLN